MNNDDYRKEFQSVNPWQMALEGYISELSEWLYTVAWLTDIEYLLWQVVQDGPTERFGMMGLDITQEHIDVLKTLSDKLGGWVALEERQSKVYPMEAWLTKFEEWKSK